MEMEIVRDGDAIRLSRVRIFKDLQAGGFPQTKIRRVAIIRKANIAMDAKVAHGPGVIAKPERVTDKEIEIYRAGFSAGLEAKQIVTRLQARGFPRANTNRVYSIRKLVQREDSPALATTTTTTTTRPRKTCKELEIVRAGDSKGLSVREMVDNLQANAFSLADKTWVYADRKLIQKEAGRAAVSSTDEKCLLRGSSYYAILLLRQSCSSFGTAGYIQTNDREREFCAFAITTVRLSEFSLMRRPNLHHTWASASHAYY
jgi:hypothetical protein